MKLIYLETIKKDANILFKYIINAYYMEKLNKVKKIIDSLEIDDEITYYKYQNILNELKGISYFEATFLTRIKNKEYFDLIKRVLPYVQNTYNRKRTIKSKIIVLKKR